MRIVSLVPSITELLYSLGLHHEVVGITKFCIHPNSWFRNKERIGGTKDIHIEKIRALQPELVIAGKEENDKAQVEAVARFCEVHTTDVKDFDSALEMIVTIGTLTGRHAEANHIVNKIAESFEGFSPGVLSAAYLIWKDPWMTAGGDTFIHAMMQKAGFGNIFSEELRYPETTLDMLNELKPEYILLSSEPYPFNEKHCKELTLRIPSSKIVLVDGEMFSWYGSRMLYAAAYFKHLLLNL